MVEKIININIDDENSGKIAEILGNKTCKKILGLVAEKDSISEGDIAKELKIPANTANYNLKKLISAGFIEETAKFFWSVKGKKIKMYSLSNKKIIISTKKSFRNLLMTSVFVGLVGLIVKVGLNYSEASGVSNSIQDSLKEKSVNLVYSAAPLVAKEFITRPSIFQGALMWFIFGCLMGLAGYFIFKKMKGGKK